MILNIQIYSGWFLKLMQGASDNSICIFKKKHIHNVGYDKNRYYKGYSTSIMVKTDVVFHLKQLNKSSTTSVIRKQLTWWSISIIKFQINTMSVTWSKPTWCCLFSNPMNYFWYVFLTSVPSLNWRGGWRHDISCLTNVMFGNIQHRLGQVDSETDVKGLPKSTLKTFFY